MQKNMESQIAYVCVCLWALLPDLNKSIYL